MPEYNVVQFFENDTYEYVRRMVSMEEAVKVFNHYTHSVAVQMKMVKRVIITDGGDCICAEWILGEGVVFPKPENIEIEVKDETDA